MDYTVVARILFFVYFVFSATWAETKFVNGHNDGISVYVTIKSNGHIYKTSDVGSATNAKLWKLLNDKDKRKLLHYYYRPGLRNADFGPGAADMAKWANDTQGWTALIEALKQKRANKSYPALKAFYSKPLKIPVIPGSAECTEQILNSGLNKEMKELSLNINENYGLGQQIYQKLINIKWNQISVAVKGISSNLIPIIADNFMTSFMTNGASHMSQVVANLYSFAKSTIDSAKNKPNDAAELIRKIGTLCDMMEIDAKTAQKFVEQDIEKFKKKSEQLAELCKQDYEQKKKFDKKKKEASKKAGASPAIDTGLKITSNAKTKEEREREIGQKAEGLVQQLYKSLYKIDKKARRNLQDLLTKFTAIEDPKNPSFCGNKYTYSLKGGSSRVFYSYKMPTSPNSSCFSMHNTVENIKRWRKDFLEYISAQDGNLQKIKKIHKQAKKDFKTTLKRLVQVQGQINEVINKYKKYLPKYLHSNYSIGDSLLYFSDFIDKNEKSIKLTEAKLETARNGVDIIDKGLARRIDREKSLIKPYSSLEDNFVNSLIQIRDAIALTDRIYKSYRFIDLRGHIPRLNNAKLNQLLDKIHLLSTSSAQEKKINDIVKKLQKDQIEIRHQMKRLLIGQNNAVYDLELLNQFLTSYTGIGPNFPSSIKEDVKEVTGVTIKSPYYDIVKDWSNGDAMLWMQGDAGNWLIKPNNLLLNTDIIIAKLHNGGSKIKKLENIYKKIKEHKAVYLSMDRKIWTKTFNRFSSQMYMIAQSDHNGIANKKVNKMYVKAYNLLNEINEANLNRGRVSNALPVLKQDIQNAHRLLLEKAKDDSKYATIMQKLQDDTKEGSEAYYARKLPILAPLFVEIDQLIVQLQDALNQNNIDLENDKIQRIKTFYKDFKEAYESKDESQVVDLISNDWKASQGGDISDLEDNLARAFRVFDEIEYDISDLNIQPLQNNRYMVSYNINIIGQIYDDDITHEEKSSVREEVGIGHGKVLIMKTYGGHYWSIK